MSTRKFRFGLVAGYAPDAKSWVAEARRAEELGYATLLIPDTLWTLSPFPALAVAATATTDLVVGTHVLAAPFRTPGALAREVDTLDLLSDGRFELGLGTGRPGGGEDEAARLGTDFGSAAERLAQVSAGIAAVRSQLEGKGRTAPRVMVAGTGRRMFELAAAEADIITLGLQPEATVDELATTVDRLREVAGSRFDRLELAMNLTAVGGQLPEYVERRLGLDVATLRAGGAYGVVDGTPAEMADVLRRRRDQLGISYVTVGTMFAEQFAPVVELLAGT